MSLPNSYNILHNTSVRVYMGFFTFLIIPFSLIFSIVTLIDWSYFTAVPNYRGFLEFLKNRCRKSPDQHPDRFFRMTDAGVYIFKPFRIIWFFDDVASVTSFTFHPVLMFFVLFSSVFEFHWVFKGIFGYSRHI